MKSAPARKNPFPGLRPFTQEEDYLFFGREEQTLELLQRLGSNRFVAVVGTSGSGKSSLVRCGLLSELLGGRMLDAGAAWEIAVTHPGGNPLALLTEALLEADLYDREEEDSRENLLATLSRSHFGLVEAVKQADLGAGTNFLLVVDQFEEIFRFHEAGQRQQEMANEFVSLLLEAAAQKDVPIYVVLTMRSDFIGECGQFEGLAEMVNRGEFLIPRLTRDQYKRVIEGPIKVAGGQIAPRLLQRLLNDLGQQADQLPCLQHALMRTWDVWAGNGDTEALDLDDYQRVGKMSQALSLHADEIFESLASDRQRELCRGMFQALTVEESNSRGIRRPQRLGRLCEILEVPADELLPIIDAYRQSGVTFLMPSPEIKLTDQTIIDISHESLMRVWTRLRQWVEEETQAAGIYHRLSESADLHEQGKAGLYRDPELGIALAWREAKRPNAAWANRYRPGFAAAMAFLEASQQASVAEEQALEATRQRELEQAQRLAEAQRLRLEQQQRAARKLRTMLAGLAAVAVVAVVACFVALVANNKANELTKIASREADNAKQEQRKTETALTEVALQREKAEGLLQKSISAEKAALEAEQRSREFRYATDMQLAATLVADSTANSGQVLTRLSDHDPEENATLAGKPDLRGFEWHYLKQLAGGRASIIKGFGKDVVDTALSPEGELVTLTSDSRLQRWTPATGQEARPALDLKRGRTIGAQALSRDGRQAALAVGNEVSLVDAVTGQEQPRTLPAQARGSLLFSPDGRMVITVDTGVGWWDAATGKPLAVQDFKLIVQGSADYRTPVSVSADGLTLVVGGQGSYRAAFSVFRLNPQTREILALASGATDTGTKRTLAISPDGQTVAVSYFFQGALALYETATGKLLHQETSAHSASISSIAFQADGSELATASLDGTIKLWKDFKTLDVAKAISLMGHSDQVVALAYSPGKSRLISAGQDKTVRLWDLEQNTSSLHRAIVGSGGLRARYSPDGTLMAIAGEFQLQLRDGMTGRVLRQFPRRSDGLSADSVAFSPDGRLLAAGFGGKADASLIELWDIDRRERIAELPGTTAIPGFTTTEHTGIVGALAFSPDGKQLVAGFGSLNLLGWGDRGKFPLLVYDVAAKRVVRRLEGHGNTCASVDFSSDGTRMASASMDGTARLWDAATWQEQQVLHNPDPATDLGQRRVYDVAFSPDGKLLAMASAEGHVIIWDAKTGEYRQTLRGHANEVWAVAFSPDGLTLASGSIDNTVRLWNVATWRELVRLDPKVPMDTRSLAFSPDGHSLLSAGFRGGSVLWSVRPAGERFGPKPDQLSQWLRTGADFQTRVRMHSEDLQLFEPLEKLAQQIPDDETVQAGLAATRANWHASRQEWTSAVEQFDHLRALGVPSPDAWLRTPGLLRLAEALLHERRPADAAALLTGGEKRRADDGSGMRVVAFGFEYTPGQYPLKLARVHRGSPAWKAGLRAGDRLLKFNDVELTAKTAADYGKAAAGGEGTKLQLTIQHPSLEQPVTVELTKASHIQDDLTVEQIERLLAAVDAELSDSLNDPGLLELRAELAGQSSESDKQVADYTAAIAALETQEPQPEADLQRLHRRRGDAYVRLKQWQLALDDYAQGIAAETTDEVLLANRASAQAEVLVADRQESLENVWFDDAPPAGAKLEGDTPWEIVGRPEHPVYSGERSFRRRAQGLSQHFFTEGKPGLKITKGGVLFAYVYLDPQDPPQAVMLQFNDGNWGHRAYWGADLITWGEPDTVSRKSMGPLPKTGEWVRLEVPVDKVGLKPGAELNGWAFTQFAGTCYWDRAGTTGSLGAYDSPWQKLAAAYRLVDDQPAIDQLVEQRPQSAGLIGDLFTQGDDRDWPRAIAFYNRAIAPDTTDADLLARRARAHEALKDWNAAAEDWSRAAGENPERMKLLTEFADRLVKAEQQERAATQRQRARQVLETVLQADPEDAPVADRLAQILLDLSEPKPPEWTVLTPAASTTGGATLVLQDDHSIVLERGQDSFILPADGLSVSAIRLETSPDAAAPGDGAATPFKEYRIVSTRTTLEGLRGRYVRIDLPGDNQQFPRADNDGDNKSLNLTEVQVFQGDRNIALNKPARQFNTWRDSFGDWEAARAVDGNTDARPEARSTAHTAPDNRNPWWEVDLGGEQTLDRLVIWNRVGFLHRMNHFRVRVLNADRQVLYEEVVDEAPNPSREIRLDAVQFARVPPQSAGDDPSWQVRFSSQGEARPWKRFRISASEELPQLSADLDSSALTWSVLEPSQLAPAEGTTATARADGSLIVEATQAGALALPPWPDSAKALRIETASASPAPQTEPATFTEYRLQALDAPTSRSGAPLGRYVRIDLPGDSRRFPRRVLANTATQGQIKVLSLAEVQVFQGDENLALSGSARQSSDHDSPTAGLSVATRAVDGNTDGRFSNRSVTHTRQQPNHDPWWEVDLGDERTIDRIVVWNRTDATGAAKAPERLHHVRVQILDRSYRVIFEQMFDDAPNPSREIDCRSWLIAKTPEPDGDKPQWSLRLGRTLGPQRIRLATSDRLPTREFDHDSSALAWTVAQPTELKSSAGQTFAAQDNGSYIVESGSTDTLPLPVLPETVRSIRIETASRRGATPDKSPVFSEYRAQAVGAATDSGTIAGRYVRLDLPGENQQFPRKEGDGARKSINLAELQVFRGNENIALRKPARQSSSIDTSRTTADRAVDGNTTGNDSTNSYAHTNWEKDAWWEVDLGSEQAIDRMVVWNRAESAEVPRMNHLRVRVLDASRQVVFEQVIDEAPNPSREIACRSLFAKTAPATVDGPSQWALRLDQETGVDPGGRFRISTAAAAYSIAREEAIAEARKIALPAARLAAAYELNGQPTTAADWFGRALASVPTDLHRQPVLTSLQEHPEALSELLRRQPSDPEFQLAEARRLMKQGNKALSEQDAARALASLQSARELFQTWLSHTPEQRWTVLTPVEMKAEHGSRLTLQPDGSVFVQQPAAKDTYKLVFPRDLKDVRGLRLEALADDRLPKGGPGWAGNGNFHLKHLSLLATSAGSPGPPRPIALRNAQADFAERGLDFRGVFSGMGNSGWSVLPEVNQNHTAVFEVAEDASADRSPQLTIVLHCESEFEKHLLGRFRLSITSDVATLPATCRRYELKDGELTALDVALGKAFALQKNATEAAAALTRALSRTPEEKDRKPLIEQFPQEAAVLTLLAQQHPQDLLLQLALAKRLAEDGKRALDENRQDDALPHLAQARELFSRLAAELPDSTWAVLLPTEMASERGADLALESDGSIFVSGSNPDRDIYTITAPLASGGLTALRLETIPDERLPGQGAGRSDGAGEFLLAEVDVVLKANSGNSRPLAIPNGVADFARVDVSPQPIAQAFDANDETYWGVLPRLKEAHTAVFLLDPQTEGTGADHSLVIRLKCGNSDWPRRNLGRFRLSVTRDANAIEVAKFHQELKASGLAKLERSLGNVYGRQARAADAAAAFQQALDLAADRDSRLKILQEASAHAGVLDQLAALRPGDAASLDLLARHYQQAGDIPSARAAVARAREQYEQRLAAEPSNARLTKDLADLLLDVSPVEWATRNWTILKPTEMKSAGGATLRLLEDGSILAGGNAANSEIYTITTKAGLPNIQAFLLEAIPHESLPFGSSGRRSYDGDFALTEFKIAQSSDGREGSFAAVPLTLAICDYSQPHSPVANVLDGKDGTWWDILPHVQQPHFAAFASAAPLTIPAEGTLTFTLEFKLGEPLGLGRFRLSATDNPKALSLEKDRLAGVKIDNPWLRLGVAYRSLGDVDSALHQFVRAIELSGTDHAKAAVAQQAAAFDDLFARLLEQFPEDKSLRLGQAKQLAAMHAAANQFQAAVDVLSAVIGDFPDDLELRNLRAGASMKLGRWPDADADYARVSDREMDAGRRRAAERTRAEVQLRMGQFQAGVEAFLQDMFLDTGSQDRPREASLAALLAGNRDIARMAAQKLYEKTHSNTDSGYSWGLVQVFTAQPGLVTKKNSQKLLDAAKRAGGTQVESLTAAIHYRLGNMKEAEPLLTTKADEPQFHALAALLLFDQGKLEESRLRWKQVHDWFERERAQDPGSVIPIQQGWQNWAVRVAVYREATRKLIGSRIMELDELLVKEPDRTPELLERARLLADADLSDEALRDLDRLAALKVDTVEVHALYGRVLAALNRVEDALVHLHQAVTASSQDAAVYAARGALLLRQGKTAKARADLERSLVLEPTELAARALADLLLAEQDNVTNWTVLKPTDMKSAGGATLTGQDDGSILASGTNASGDVYTLTAVAGLDRIAAIRLEVLPDPSLPNNGPGRHSTGNFQLKAIRLYYPAAQGESDDTRLPLASVWASFDYKANNADVAGLVDERLRKVWHVWGQLGQPHQAVFLVKEPSAINHGRPLIVELRHHEYNEGINLGRFRLSVSDDPDAYTKTERRFAAMKMSDPWAKLAAAYHLIGDQPALDALLSAHPAAAAGIGDLYTAEKKWEQAIAAYDKLITPETTDAALLAKRAAAYMSSEQWELAKADWLRVIKEQPDQTQEAFNAFRMVNRWQDAAEFGWKVIEQNPDAKSLQWLAVGPILVLVADQTAYADFCGRMLLKFADSESIEDAERTVKTCLLLPNVIAPDKLPAAKFTSSLDDGTAPEGFLPWGWDTRALLAWRSGNADLVLKYVAKSEESKPAEVTHAANLALVAVAQHQLLHSDEARAALEEASQLIARLKEDPVKRVDHDLLIAEILFREAEALIKGNDRP